MKELGSEQVCLALGYFDSVHLGHRHLISAARELAQSMGVELAVATFSNNAYKLFNIEEKQVYTYHERCAMLEPLCDSVLPIRFDVRLKKCTAEQFLDSLFAKHNVAAVVCGYDYLFGAGAKGDADYLKEYCARHDKPCLVVPKYEYNGNRVSTTAVKKLLHDGKIEEANVLLGAPFTLVGKVVRGRGAGRMFDIPTANIKAAASKLLPGAGVYGATCEIDGKTYYCATNVGARPTFGLTKTTVEAMIADFNDNIYGEDIKLTFCKRLRDVKKFETPAQLSAQVHTDIRWYEND